MGVIITSRGVDTGDEDKGETVEESRRQAFRIECE